MLKSAQASPASPRSTVSRKQFDKTPDSPGDELINVAAFRGVPVEGRSVTKALHLQVLCDDHDEDVSSMGSSSMKSASSRCNGKSGKSQRSAISLLRREDLKLQALRSRITALESESRNHALTRANSAAHCKVIAKVASKKAELDKRMRRRASPEDGEETDDYRSIAPSQNMLNLTLRRLPNQSLFEFLLT